MALRKQSDKNIKNILNKNRQQLHLFLEKGLQIHQNMIL